MWEWIAFAAGIGFGIMGLAAYIKTNLDGKHREKDLQVKELSLSRFKYLNHKETLSWKNRHWDMEHTTLSQFTW